MRPSRVVHSLGWFGTSLRSSLSLLPTASLLHPFLTVDVNHLTLLSVSVLFVLLFGKFCPVWLLGKLVLFEFQQENVFVVIDGSCVFLTMIFLHSFGSFNHSCWFSLYVLFSSVLNS